MKGRHIFLWNSAFHWSTVTPQVSITHTSGLCISSFCYVEWVHLKTHTVALEWSWCRNGKIYSTDLGESWQVKPSSVGFLNGTGARRRGRTERIKSGQKCWVQSTSLQPSSPLSHEGFSNSSKSFLQDGGQLHPGAEKSWIRKVCGTSHCEALTNCRWGSWLTPMVRIHVRLNRHKMEQSSDTSTCYLHPISWWAR